MDMFDGEPYLALVPRRWVRPFALAAFLAIALLPSVREWWFDQAERHVLHEMQPLLDDLRYQSEPTTQNDPETSPSNSGAGSNP